MATKQDFDNIMPTIYKFEGGYSDHPNDLGNETNLGIIQTTYDSYRMSQQKPKQPVKLITKAEATEIYYNRYWLANCCNLMPKPLAYFVLDTCINMGQAKVISYFQELVYTKEKTINAKMINDINFYINKHGVENLVFALISRRRKSYHAFAAKPGQQVFLQGWLNRLDHLKSTIGDIA